MTTIPKALDRKVKKELPRARCRWTAMFIRENLWPLLGCALGALFSTWFCFYRIFMFFMYRHDGEVYVSHPGAFWTIAGVCFAMPLIFGMGDEFIGGWPRYDDALAAVLPNCGDEPLLHELALHYPDEKVQRTAIASMQDQKLLVDIARESKDVSLRLSAIECMRDDDLLIEAVQSDEVESVRLAALNKLNDEETLIKVALKDNNASVRKAALEKIKDEGTLKHVALQDKDADVRRVAVKGLDDKETLIDVALHDDSAQVRLAAVEKLNDEETLKQAALNDDSVQVRFAAAGKLDDEETLLEVAQHDISWFNQDVCPGCGSEYLTIDDGFSSGFYDGYNWSNPDPDDHDYHCCVCGQNGKRRDLVSRWNYVNMRIRNISENERLRDISKTSDKE